MTGECSHGNYLFTCEKCGVLAQIMAQNFVTLYGHNLYGQLTESRASAWTPADDEAFNRWCEGDPED